MKLLIVDDEKKIRNGLRFNINWKKIGVDKVYTASNGIEALKQYMQLKHEIVITDVIMPGMDGLELTEEIVKLGNNTHIIIISGFSEFEYAQRAMKLGVKDYELKPVDIMGLMELVQKACENIMERKKEQRIRKQYLTLHQSNIFKKILLGDMSYEDIERNLSTHFCIKDNDHIVCLTFEIDNFSDYVHLLGNNFSDNFQDLLRTIIIQLSNINDCIVYKKKENNYIVVSKIVSPISAYNYRKTVVEFRERLYKSLNGMIQSISIGLSNFGKSRELPNLYKQASEALEHKFYTGNGCIIYFQDVANKDGDIWRTCINEQELVEFIKNLDYESIRNIINKEFDQMKRYRCTDNDPIRNICIDLKNILFRTLNRISIDFYELFNKNVDTFEFVPWCETINQYCEWVQNMYCSILTNLSEICNITQNREMLRIAEYIKLNYNSDITMQKIAECFQKTPNYLSYLFKKEFGISFSKYLNDIRINKAIEFIQNSNMYIYEISEKVGFSSYDYFKQVFREKTGYPPSKFKSSVPRRLV